MATLKGAAVERFLKAPDPKTPIILLFGPDRGRVQVRMQALVDVLADGDPMARVDLDPALLADEPGRLGEEADSVSMFGGEKVIVARMDDPKPLAATLDALVASPPTAASIVIAAGDLKKNHAVRTRIEKSPTGMAIACFNAERADIGRELDEAVERYGLSISSDARMAVLSMLGSDHALSIAEIDKLCIACLHLGSIDIDAVETLLADSAQTALYDAADRAFAGDSPGALQALGALLAEGQEPSVIAQALYRQSIVLARLCLQKANGGGDAVIRAAKPPIFFRRQPLVARALTLWTPQRLQACSMQLDDDVTHLRLDREIAATRLERNVLRVASMARAR